jgi:hypothetical protein
MTRRRRAEYTQEAPQVNAGNPRFQAEKGRIGSSHPRVAPTKPAPYKRCPGEVPEWSIGTVSKTVVRASVPWVRIPPSPPFIPNSAIERHLRSRRWRWGSPALAPVARHPPGTGSPVLSLRVSAVSASAISLGPGCAADARSWRSLPRRIERQETGSCPVTESVPPTTRMPRSPHRPPR